MKKNINHSYRQTGFMVTTEVVLLATILVIGTILGLVAVRDSVSGEMADIAESIEHKATNQYAFNGYPSNGEISDISFSTFEPDGIEGETFVTLGELGGGNNGGSGDNGGGDNGGGTTNPPTDPPPEEPVFTDIGFLQVVDAAQLGVPTDDVSILECITLSTGYNINIYPSLDGGFSGQCEVFASPPDPSTIPSNIDQIVFLDLFDAVTGDFNSKINIADCATKLAASGSGQLYINRLEENGYGYCRVDL